MVPDSTEAVEHLLNTPNESPSSEHQSETDRYQAVDQSIPSYACDESFAAFDFPVSGVAGTRDDEENERPDERSCEQLAACRLQCS